MSTATMTDKVDLDAPAPGDQQTIWIVTRNTDFTEGRGPMLFHKAFEDEEVAARWIMAQPGIYGSEQRESSRNSDGGRSFNGYGLKPTLVIRETDMEDHEALVEELAEIEARQQADAQRAAMIRGIIK